MLTFGNDNRDFVGADSYSVEVPLTNFSAQQTNKFNDLATNSLLNPASNPNLVPVILGIETYFNTYYAYSTSTRPIVTQADAALLAVTFNVDNDEPLYQTPYLSWCTILNYGKLRLIEPTPVNLQKSYVLVQNTLASAGAASAQFNFWFMRPTKDEWKEWRENIIKNRIKSSR